MEKERFFELVYAWKDGDLTGDELYKRVFSLSDVVRRSEQLPCERCKKLEFMIEHELGWKDMENDCT